MRPGLCVLPPESPATPSSQASSQPPTQPASQTPRLPKSNSLSLFYKKCKMMFRLLTIVALSKLILIRLDKISLASETNKSPLCSVPPGLHQAEDALLLPAALPPRAGAHHMDPIPAHTAARVRADERPPPRPGSPHVTRSSFCFVLLFISFLPCICNCVSFSF